jgi:hypothetical protein
MRNVKLRSLPLLSLVLGALSLVPAACGGPSSGGSSSGSTSGGSGGDPGGCYDYTGFDGTTPTQTFAADVLPIFQSSCAVLNSCHGSNPPPAAGQHFLGPPLPATPTATDITTILAGIVSATSADNPPMDVVDPGSPENSFMMYKLDTDPASVAGVTCSTLACATSAATCLSGMPLAGMQLSSGDRTTIRQWIAQGAKND